MSIAIHRSASADCPNDEGKKKPQLLEQQPDVVAGTAQNGVQRIAQRTFERVSPESPVGLHVSDSRLDCAASFDHRVKRSANAALLSRSKDSNSLEFGALVQAGAFNGLVSMLLMARLNQIKPSVNPYWSPHLMQHFACNAGLTHRLHEAFNQAQCPSAITC